MSEYAYKTFKASFPTEHVLHIEMNRPQMLNAMDRTFWKECRQIGVQAALDDRVRAVILSGGDSKHFSAGLDLSSPPSFGEGGEFSRQVISTRKLLKEWQSSFSVFAECPVPVIAIINGACIGGAIDMITACDIRWCTKDAYFSIKEVDLGLAADLGTLQRLPKIVGKDSLVRELAFSARKFDAREALLLGLVSRVLEDQPTMLRTAIEFASDIAANSPVAVRSTKRILEYSRDHSVADGLDYVATWNAAMLQSSDLQEAVLAKLEKRKPVFSKL